MEKAKKKTNEVKKLGRNGIKGKRNAVITKKGRSQDGRTMT